MAEEKSSQIPQPTLPKAPKQDVWGRDLPMPNASVEATEEIAESIGDLAKTNAELFDNIVAQFSRYTDAIKASNQNFLLKQGKLLVLEFKKGIIEGLVTGAEKSGDSEKLDFVNENLVEVANGLDRLIEKQEKANVLATEAHETAQEQATRDKNEKQKETEAQRESWLRRFFTGSEKPKNIKDKAKKESGGFFDGIMDKLAFTIPAVKALIPLMAGLSLFFVDFDELLSNPMWGKLSKLIQEKLIPGIGYLFENVIRPLANFLINTTLPAVITGLIEAVDDIVVLVKDLIDAFSASTWQEGLNKGVRSLFNFLGNIGNTLLDMTLESFGIDSVKWREQLKADWEETKKMWRERLGEDFWNSLAGAWDWFVKSLDNEVYKSEGFAKDWEKTKQLWRDRWARFVSDWNGTVELWANRWETLTNIGKRISDDWEGTKQLWRDRWTNFTGGVSAMVKSIADKWSELTNNAYDSNGLMQDWEDSKAQWQGWKDKITTAFWSFIDAVRDSVVQAFTDLKDYFAALPGRIWAYVMDSVKAIPGAEWMLEKLGYAEGAVAPSSPALEPVRNIMIEDAAKKNNLGGMPDFIGGMNRFSGATDAFKADSQRRDKGGAAPVIVTAPQTNQRVTTTYGGPSYMAPTRTGNDRSFFGAK